MVFKALQMAAEAHRNQERKGSGLPYIIHPIGVAFLLGKYKLNSHRFETLTIAAIFHDCPEDTKLQLHKIAEIFSMEVASLVFELTSDPKEIERLGKNPYLMKKCVGMSSYGLTLKMCDRLANIMDKPTEKYIEDTRELMMHIYKERRLTKTQTTILNDIFKVCDEFDGMV